MSKTWISSDLHLGHARIGKYRDGIDSPEDNTKWIVDWWLANVRPRDTVILLGDTAFNEEAIDIIAELPGRKVQIGGNHDDQPVTSYLRAFDVIRGCQKFKKLGWLSHFPLHPDELRGHFSIHGHVHYATIDDWRYINVCCDNLQKNIGQPMIELSALRRVQETRRVTKTVTYEMSSIVDVASSKTEG